VSKPSGLLRPILALLSLSLIPCSALAQTQPNELDAFMEKVLAQRERNRITLQQYVLDERETFEVVGPARVPLHRQDREFTWYVRDGVHVRSPVRFAGVSVGEEERREYEEDWLRRERAREERKKKKDTESGKPVEPAGGQDPADPSGATPLPAPRFVSEAYFMEFKFEPGDYYLAGREKLDGVDVLRIEYYPKEMFKDDGDVERERERERQKQQRRKRREITIKGGDDVDPRRIERQMNKTALITLWVDPKEHQIVKYTFDNVWMDFLPGAWLVRVDEIRASMEMGQPFPGVWLPRGLEIKAGATLAMGSFDGVYSRTFKDYRQAEVKTKITIPKAPESNREVWPDDGEAGPFVEDLLPQSERVTEIRVHGNAFVEDADVVRISGITTGQAVDDAALKGAQERLERSGLFESVEVRKRYRSLTDSSDVSLLLIVHERPGVRSASQSTDVVNSSWRRIRSKMMFFPILTYADGYAFTYGGRVSAVDLLGAGERWSVPLTWGGTRKAALEFERLFERGPFTRVFSSFGIWQRENPSYEIDDQRVEWLGRVERHFAGIVRTGFEVSDASVEFGAADERLWTMGADVALDTRRDPAFPRNAVYLGAGWTGLDVHGPATRVNRYLVDTRGYVGVFRQLVLAARAQYTAADAPLPIYERILIGGASTLRGFNAGEFTGDRAFVTSAELRLPITSVLNAAKLGVYGFADAAKAYDYGTRFEDAPWRQSAGAGAFMIASVVRLNLEVGHGFKTGDTRVHFGMGFAF
jgi:hypothetical protein